MTRDESGLHSRDHRAGSRLAPSRPENRNDIPRRKRVPPTPKPDPEIDLDGIVSGKYLNRDDYDQTQESSDPYDPSEAIQHEIGSGGSHGNGYGNGRGNGYQDPPTIQDEDPYISNDSSGPYDSNPQYPLYPPRITAPGELSKQEQQLLLMHTIQLYDDEWRLNSIRTSSSKGWLVAFLTPRAKSLDLQQAIKRQMALRITVDRRGNTDVSIPKRHGILRRILTWIRGA